ncbi:MAG: DUF5615 family PIN-like protein [Leeuwenhoekiella sp.]
MSKVKNLFSETEHVKNVGLTDALDIQIREFALKNGYDAIVTCDKDFIDLATILGTPPKIVWLRLFNPTTIKIVEALETNIVPIENFIGDPSLAEKEILEIGYRGLN